MKRSDSLHTFLFPALCAVCIFLSSCSKEPASVPVTEPETPVPAETVKPAPTEEPVLQDEDRFLSGFRKNVDSIITSLEQEEYSEAYALVLSVRNLKCNNILWNKLDGISEAEVNTDTNLFLYAKAADEVVSRSTETIHDFETVDRSLLPGQLQAQFDTNYAEVLSDEQARKEPYDWKLIIQWNGPLPLNSINEDTALNAYHNGIRDLQKGIFWRAFLNLDQLYNSFSVKEWIDSGALKSLRSIDVYRVWLYSAAMLYYEGEQYENGYKYMKMCSENPGSIPRELSALWNDDKKRMSNKHRNIPASDSHKDDADPYDTDDYSDPEEFYYWHENDFYDYEEAEEYFYSHHK